MFCKNLLLQKKKKKITWNQPVLVSSADDTQQICL